MWAWRWVGSFCSFTRPSGRGLGGPGCRRDPGTASPATIRTTGHQRRDRAARRILNAGAEKICWRGVGNVVVNAQWRGADGGTLTPNSCVTAAAGVTGRTNVDVLSNQVSAPSGTCASAPPPSATSTAGQSTATSGWDASGRVPGISAEPELQPRVLGQRKRVAVVPGGATGRDAVIEMQMRGVSGPTTRCAPIAVAPC